MKTLFHARLEIKVKQAISDREQDIGRGGIADYSAYREQVGYLHGLRTALDLCDEIEREIGNERGDPPQND